MAAGRRMTGLVALRNWKSAPKNSRHKIFTHVSDIYPSWLTHALRAHATLIPTSSLNPRRGVQYPGGAAFDETTGCGKNTCIDVRLFDSYSLPLNSLCRAMY